MNAETGSYMPAAKDGFALLPVLEVIFAPGGRKLTLRFRSDATAAIAAVEQGFSKQAAYLKDTRQFRVNLAFLKETIAKYLEKLPSPFMTADPMTKPLPALEFHYHKNFSLMIQKKGNNRCKCLCKMLRVPCVLSLSGAFHSVMKNIVNIVLKHAIVLASADMSIGTPRSSCLNLKSGCRTLRNLSCGVEGGGVEKLSRVEVVGRERPILAVPIHRMRTAMVHRKNAA